MSKILFENSNIEFIDGDRGKNYPKQEDFSDKGHCMFLSAKNVTSCGFNFDNKVFISSEKDNQLKAGKLKRNDIVITTRGTIGNVAIYDDKVPYNDVRINSGMLILRADSNKLDTKFLYYYLSSKEFKEQVNSLISGSAVPQLPIRDIKKLTLPNITKKQQEKIANIISSFEDRIELNTQINQTLEQIAQALFKSWFVDFDPVRAKVQALSDGLSLEQAELAAMQAISGKTPEELTALSQTQPERYAELAETAKAFPCEMVEVDGVEVPKGWKIGTFTDITESRREKVKNDKATVLSAVSSGELVKSEEYFTKQVFSKSIDKYLKVYQWDFAYNPARINIGSIGLHEAAYLGAVSPVYEVFSVSDKYHWFLKRILNLETTKIKIQSLCTGSVRQTLKLKDFQSIDCVIPDEKTLSIFNKKWEEYRTLILENNKNTQTLSEIRDLLLPRLLSGDFND